MASLAKKQALPYAVRTVPLGHISAWSPEQMKRLAMVTDEDVKQAVARWNAVVPAKWHGLLTAKVEK